MKREGPPMDKVASKTQPDGAKKNQFRAQMDGTTKLQRFSKKFSDWLFLWVTWCTSDWAVLSLKKWKGCNWEENIFYVLKS